MTDINRICGAQTRSGAKCMLPGMANGRCRLHGGKSTGPVNPRVKHGLYRKSMSSEESELYDALKNDSNYADMRSEAALLRILIQRCAGAILKGEEYRVPMQVLPQYMEKLVKVLDRLDPGTGAQPGQKLGMNIDMELQQMLKEETEMQDAERERQIDEL